MSRFADREVARTIRVAILLVFGTFVYMSSAVAAERPDYRTGYDVKDTVKKVFAAERGGTLEVDADLGNVEIRSGRSSEVRVVVERIVGVESKDEAKSVLEAHKLVIDRKGSAIWVHSRVNKDRYAWKRSSKRLRIRIIVEVPDEYNLDIASGVGNVSVLDVRGVANVRTGAGNVEVDNTSGTLDIVSGSGNIDVRTAAGSVAVKNGAGNLVLENVQGRVQAETGAGNITARIISDLDGDSRLTTSAGNITVSIADHVGANVHAVAKVGSCSTDYPLQISGSWMKKSFDGAINGGGPELSLRANVGSVVLNRLD